MTNMVERFAVQLTPAQSQILADARNFVDWQTQSQNQMFVPRTVDDVAIHSTDGYREEVTIVRISAGYCIQISSAVKQKSRFL